MVTGVCENQFAAARKLLILQRRDAGAVDQARLESVRFQCGGRAYEPAKVGSSRGKARWRKGPAAPTASDVLRGRSRREGHRCVSPSPLIEPDVDHLGHPALGRVSRDGMRSGGRQNVSGDTTPPVPQRPQAWETADGQTRQSCAGPA